MEIFNILVMDDSTPFETGPQTLPFCGFSPLDTLPYGFYGFMVWVCNHCHIEVPSPKFSNLPNKLPLPKAVVL